MQMQGITGLQNLPDNTLNPIALRADKYGALVASELRGKYSEQALRGRSFTASTVIAGVVIPVAAATLNSKFTLWNPASSGVVIEPISVGYGIDSATTVVNGHGFLIQRGLTAGAGIPTSLTAIAALRMGVSGSSAVGVYSQATLTNVAIPGVSAATAVPIAFYPTFSHGAVTSVASFDLTHNFDGKLLLEPDSLMAACTTVTASTASFIQICWIEHLI